MLKVGEDASGYHSTQWSVSQTPERSEEVNHMSILKKHVLGRGNGESKGFQLGYYLKENRGQCDVSARGEGESGRR